MSAPEHQQVEQRSSVKISQTAKGDPVVEVKVYDGTVESELDYVREMAVRAFKGTVEAVRWSREP